MCGFTFSKTSIRSFCKGLYERVCTLADILNSVFSGYDRIILTILHFLSRPLGFLLTPLAKLITFLGEKGIVFLLLAFVLMCMKRTRKLGVCMFGAVCCGALITNIVLKDLIARPRPFEGTALYREWWMAVGSPAEDGFSFPSGHITAAAAGMTSLCFAKDRRYWKPAVAVVLAMAVSRNYLMAHYPSDVLFGALVGVLSAFIAWRITVLIFRFLNKHKDNRVCSFMLELDIDIASVLRLLPTAVPGKKRKKGKHEL